MAKKKKTSGSKKNHRLIYIFALLGIFFLTLSIFLRQDKLPECANSISCITDMSGEYDSSQTEGEFMGKIVKVPGNLDFNTNSNSVLGDSTASNKKIEVDLTNQKLYAKEGDRVIYEFTISSGKWGRTPTGKFSVWSKLNSTRMSGGSKELGTYYNLPNVPYTMFFYNNEIPKSRGYGIHGAYWHNNFGTPMSHGCINMKVEDAKVLYDWATPASIKHTTYADKDNPGTTIEIYGKFAN